MQIDSTFQSRQYNVRHRANQAQKIKRSQTEK